MYTEKGNKSLGLSGSGSKNEIYKFLKAVDKNSDNGRGRP